MPIFDYKCECGYEEEKIVLDMDSHKYEFMCPKCGRHSLKKQFSAGASFTLKYNPLTDKCDWDGNTTQYYRSYNEAKEKGEKVRIPEKGEPGYHQPEASPGYEKTVQ